MTSVTNVTVNHKRQLMRVHASIFQMEQNGSSFQVKSFWHLLSFILLPAYRNDCQSRNVDLYMQDNPVSDDRKWQKYQKIASKWLSDCSKLWKGTVFRQISLILQISCSKKSIQESVQADCFGIEGVQNMQVTLYTDLDDSHFLLFFLSTFFILILSFNQRASEIISKS